MRRLLGLALAVLLMTSLCASTAYADSFDDGMKQFNGKNFPVALVLFKSSEKAGIKPSAALYYQALCYHYQSQFDKAAEAYSDVCTRYPSTPAAANARAALNSLTQSRPSPAKVAVANATQVSQPAGAFPLAKKGTPLADWYMGIDTFIGEIPFVYSGSRILVVASIQGKAVPAIFDTGANLTVFGKTALEKAGVDLRSSHKGGTLHGVAGQISYDTMQSKVRLGNMFAPIDVAIENDTAEARNGGGRPIGLIGADVFAEYVFEVDPSAQVIRFLKRVQRSSERSAANAKLGERFTWLGDSILVTAKVNGRECPMIFDTGCSGLAFSDKQLGSAGLNRPVDSSRGSSTGIGGRRESYGFEIDNVSLGPVTKKKVDASVGVYSTQDYPLLGMGFLGGMRFIVDPAKEIIRFMPPR